MRHEIKLCDLCHNINPVNGIGFEIFKSIGGWGSKQTDVYWSGEVCEKCYEEYKIFSDAVNIWLKKREGNRPAKITVTEHNVSIVSTDEPQSERRKIPLLW